MPRHAYSSWRPSGEKRGSACTPATWYASPPNGPVRRNQTSSSAPSRRLVKASSAPSEDQVGALASNDGLVKRYGCPEPSVGAIQISECRRSLSSTMVVTVNAARRPSGDSAGSPTNVIL